jgi:hypothetical protein
VPQVLAGISPEVRAVALLPGFPQTVAAFRARIDCSIRQVAVREPVAPVRRVRIARLTVTRCVPTAHPLTVPVRVVAQESRRTASPVDRVAKVHAVPEVNVAAASDGRGENKDHHSPGKR